MQCVDAVGVFTHFKFVQKPSSRILRHLLMWTCRTRSAYEYRRLLHGSSSTCVIAGVDARIAMHTGACVGMVMDLCMDKIEHSIGHSIEHSVKYSVARFIPQSITILPNIPTDFASTQWTSRGIES